jgi:hypothetical protein
VPKDYEVIEDQLKEVEAVMVHPRPRRALSDWERGFIVSVRSQFDRTNSLSKKQQEILERIYADKT